MKTPAIIQRIVRMSFKGFIFPVTSFLAFTILLSFMLVLYKPSPGPTKQMRIGWQEWDAIVFNSPAASNQNTTANAPANNEDKTTDWWNSEDDSNNDWRTSTLPLDEWLPLQVHDAGISEITMTKCFIDHAYGFCYPDTTPEEDSHKGKWTRVERDLQAKTGIYYLAFYYRRTRRLDVPLVSDLKLLGAGQENLLSHPLDQWRGIGHSLRDGVAGQPPLYLWYKLGPTMGQILSKNVTQADDLIMELDVLNGDGRPFYGFEKLEPPLAHGKVGQSENVHMVYKRGTKPVPRAKPLHFSHAGHFKILQVADLHFSVSNGRCRDTALTPCNGDDETLALMNRTLDLEKPDLVVFSGDQLNGQGTTWDPRSILAKFAGPVIDRQIPWAMVFGNHDSEDGDLTRLGQLRILRDMPYSLVEAGPPDVHGKGNYVVPIRSPDPSRTQLLTLYFLDSGAYSEGMWDWFGFTPTEYDYLRQSQIDWFLHESSLVPMYERPWKPDTGKDLGDAWKRANQGKKRQTTQRSLVKPNALMFYHIPIQETYSTPDIDPLSNKKLEIGEQLDDKGTPKKNDGFFEKGLLKAVENELGGREVKIVANGHNHLTNSCRRVLGIWFCFNGGSSYSGYGKAGVDRRFRVFNVTDWGETITTYGRTEHGEIIDQIVLVGHGGPTPYEG